MSNLQMSKAVMQQALEALEQIDGAMPFPVGRSAITALRAALKETEQRADAHLFYTPGDVLICKESGEKVKVINGNIGPLQLANGKIALEWSDTVYGEYTLGQIMDGFIRERRTEPEQEPIKWELNGDDCGYTNWLGITPFGRILITWKGWKQYHDATVDEFPGGFEAYGSPDEVKAACEAEYLRRVQAHPPQRKPVPLTDEEIDDIWNRYCDEMGEASINDAYDIARAIEAAHGIKQEDV